MLLYKFAINCLQDMLIVICDISLPFREKWYLAIDRGFENTLYLKKPLITFLNKIYA